jgi:hypothetical protein
MLMHINVVAFFLFLSQQGIYILAGAVVLDICSFVLLQKMHLFSAAFGSIKLIFLEEIYFL